MDRLCKTCEYLIYLISCALRGTEVKVEFLDGIDLAGLFILAQKHSVAAMVCMALETTDVFEQAEPVVKKQWQNAKNRAVRKNMLLDADRQMLMDEMENARIWHMPLKGSILKDWYPRYGMREMSDNDILFDATKREQVKDIFLRHGYSVHENDLDNQDVYFKPPVYNFEMHTSLFTESTYKELAQKYEGIVQELIPDENKEYCLHFTPEDFYVYALVHAHKHYSHCGTGIRTLADIYVMNRRIGPSMDWNYVREKMESFGIQAYEKCSRELAEKVFCDIPVSEIILTEEEQRMLLNYTGVGAYGSFENCINIRLHSIQADTKPITGYTKFKYFMARLFPGREWCKDNYPFVYQHPYLMPFFWVWRWIIKIPANKKMVQKELSALRSSK